MKIADGPAKLVADFVIQLPKSSLKNLTNLDLKFEGLAAPFCSSV